MDPNIDGQPSDGLHPSMEPCAEPRGEAQKRSRGRQHEAVGATSSFVLLVVIHVLLVAMHLLLSVGLPISQNPSCQSLSTQVTSSLLAQLANL